MSGEFSNKVAVVTGGSRGIGREIALEFTRSGAQTVIVSSSADNLSSAAKTIRWTNRMMRIGRADPLRSFSRVNSARAQERRSQGDGSLGLMSASG
jgi:NAD(P)-dependent dehydrogenase (short-subunit alcohol dehydrogenase family)